MNKLVFKIEKDRYDIYPYENSSWCNVYKNKRYSKNPIALVMNEEEAIKVVADEVKRYGRMFLGRADFDEVQIRNG